MRMPDASTVSSYASGERWPSTDPISSFSVTAVFSAPLKRAPKNVAASSTSADNSAGAVIAGDPPSRKAPSFS